MDKMFAYIRDVQIDNQESMNRVVDIIGTKSVHSTEIKQCLQNICRHWIQCTDRTKSRWKATLAIDNSIEDPWADWIWGEAKEHYVERRPESCSLA
jgi:hypothetical protein